MTIQELEEVLDRKFEQQERIHKLMLAPIVKSLEGHHETIYGNGKSGLKTDVIRLKVYGSIIAFLGGIIATGILGTMFFN